MNRLPSSSGEPLGAAKRPTKQGQNEPGQEHDAYHLDEVQDREGMVPNVEGGGQQVIHKPKDDTESDQPPRAAIATTGAVLESRVRKF